MSRPIRPCLLLLPALSVLSTGCSTAYTRMYSPAKSYYQAPTDKTSKADAEKLLGPADAQPAGRAGGMPPGTPPGELPPAPVAPMPGGEVPAADPLNMQPGEAPPLAPAPTPAPPL